MKMNKLGEIADVQWGDTSITKASYVPSGYIAYSAAGGDGFLGVYQHEGEGIVLSAIGAQCGKCFFAEGKWTAIKNTITIKPDPTVADARYLYYFLTRRNVWQSRGAGQPFITLGSARLVVVPLPPLPEQKRIAAILDKADEIRRKREKAIELTDSFLRSVFLEMFGDIKANPKDWKRCTLGDVIRLKSGESMSANARSETGTIPVYGGNGVTGFHNKTTHNQPTIVVGRVGVYCGCVHITEPLAWITDNALAVSISCADVLQDFLFWGLKIANLNQYASQSAQPLVSGGRIYPVPFFIPPLDLQRRFAAVVERFAETQSKVTDSMTTTRALEASLSFHLFSSSRTAAVKLGNILEVAHAL